MDFGENMRVQLTKAQLDLVYGSLLNIRRSLHGLCQCMFNMQDCEIEMTMYTISYTKVATLYRKWTRPGGAPFMDEIVEAYAMFDGISKLLVTGRRQVTQNDALWSLNMELLGHNRDFALLVERIQAF